MTAIDRLRNRFFDDGSPPSTDQVLRDAVLELAASVHDLEVIMRAVVDHDEVLRAKKPRKKYKARNPRGGKGADTSPAAQARAAPSGSPPPDGPPASNSRYGM